MHIIVEHSKDVSNAPGRCRRPKPNKKTSFSPPHAAPDRQEDRRTGRKQCISISLVRRGVVGAMMRSSRSPTFFDPTAAPKRPQTHARSRQAAQAHK